MNDCPKLSIIVPVYNRESSITCCINSILDSEFRNFEILLIDDGSTDSTFELCEKLAKADNRIRFYRQDNKGVSSARNYGLSLCRGFWITFVDSDDAILPMHLNVLTLKNIDSADIIMTGYTSGFCEDKKIIVKDKNCCDKSVPLYSPNAVEYLFGDFKPFDNNIYQIWNKFFKRNIISYQHLRFDETISLGEDQVFLCGYLLYAKGLYYFKQKSYINLFWEGITHLGSQLRTPSDYLYNQKKNYVSLCRLISLGGNNVTRYAINYGINRPITRILLNYTKPKNRCVIEVDELVEFTKLEILPFILSIDVSKYNAIDYNVRLLRLILVNFGPKMAIYYCLICNYCFRPIVNIFKRIVCNIMNIK